MTFGRKLLILFIVILFMYILFNLLKNKQAIINKKEQPIPEKQTEGFSQGDPDYNYVTSEVKTLAIDETQFPSGILSVGNNLLNMNINQFCIKGSSNSAYSGNYISDTMVRYVLSRGCRFLDFEIYYLPDSTGKFHACVGYSSDPAAVSPTISNKNAVLFLDLLKSAISGAFINHTGETYYTTNRDDPLFIHLRLKTGITDRQKLYDSVQTALSSLYTNSTYSDYFFRRPWGDNYISGYTRLSELRKKMIIIFENNSMMPSNFPLSNSESPTSGNFYNAISNSDTIQKSFYSELNPAKFIANPPKVATAMTVTFQNNSKLRMVVPENNKQTQTNPNLFSSIQNYGNQITLFQYHVNDTQLIENEQMFKTYGTSIVPMSYCLSYINNYASPEDIQPVAASLF